MSDSSNILRNLAYIAVASCSLVMAGCGGSSSSSSDDQDPIVTPEPTPEPAPEPTPDPQPETLVYTGSEDDADLSDADLNAVAAEVIKATLASAMLESIDPYMDYMDYLGEDLAGDFGGYFISGPIGLSAAEALDLELSLVNAESGSGTFTIAGDCGGTSEFTYEESFANYAGEDEAIGYGEEFTNERSAVNTLTDDFCDDDFYVNGESPKFNGSAEFDGSMNFYFDGNEGGYYANMQGSAEMSVDITVAATGLDARYQAANSISMAMEDDDRAEPSVQNGSQEVISNERFTINGAVIERTFSLTASSMGPYEDQQLLGFDGSVFSVGYDSSSENEGYYEVNLDAYYSEYGLIYSYGEDLILCEDGSGFASGSIEFEDDESTVALITFTGCETAPVVTDESEPEVLEL